ncbi:MAG: hypothetical protein ACJA0H_000833 [Francisellaceae bacterium]
MKLGIMQPYFFPHLGHFALIAAVEQWVVFDVTQYTPKSWMNRNRVLHPVNGWNYVSIPLIKSSTSIKSQSARVKNIQESKQTILGKLSHYKKSAPFYSQVIELVTKTFEREKTDSLVDLNVSALKEVCQYLNISFKYRICSELDIPFPNNISAGQWAPLICNHLKATGYINPLGGKALFDVSEFEQFRIDLYFLDFLSYQYDTNPYDFESNLSILDVMMWNSPEKIKKVIDAHSLLIRG